MRYIVLAALLLLAGCNPSDPFAKKPAPNATGPQWEIYSDRGTKTAVRTVWRMKVDGGWLYTNARTETAMTFVPDAE
jgi:hypothetical protein